MNNDTKGSRNATALGVKNKRLEISANFKKAEKAEGDVDGFIYIEGYASTDEMDRHGDIIPPSAWNKKALKNFRANPIVLFNHSLDKVIGKVVELLVDEKGLFVKCAIDVSDVAGRKISMGLLKTFSIGFYLLDFDYSPEKEAWIIKELELLEVSVVSIPANQGATFSLEKQLGINEVKEYKKSILKENTMSNEMSVWDKFWGKDVTEEAAVSKLEKISNAKTALEAKVSVLETEKATLENEKTALELEKTTLQTEKAAFGTEKTTLETEKTTLETEKTALETEKAALETEKATSVTEVAALKVEVDALKVTISKNKGLKKQVAGGQDPIVKKVRKYKGNEAASELNYKALMSR
jgi:HK97 family phage prohead protease